MRQYETREARFSSRVLQNYRAANLPETLAVVRPNNAAEQVEILLYDEIGYFGTTAKDFVVALSQADNVPIRLRINSPGGDVFDGLAIYNALKSYPAPVDVVVDGLAASAASFIALAGTSLRMAENSMLMIHKAWGLVIGNEQDMTETAEVLRKIDGQIASIYADKTNRSPSDILQMMADETWLTSQEAKDAGFADLIEAQQRVMASADTLTIKANADTTALRAQLAALQSGIGSIAELASETETETAEETLPQVVDGARFAIARARQRQAEAELTD